MKKIYEVMNIEGYVLNDYLSEKEARDFMAFAASKGVDTWMKVLTVHD